MRRISIISTATAAISAALSGTGVTALVTPDGMPEKKRAQAAPRITRRRGRNRMPHYGAKESAKRYAEVRHPHTGHTTIHRVA